MKMRFRILALLLSLLIVVPIFASCDTENDTSDSKGIQNTKSTENTTSASERPEIETKL